MTNAETLEKLVTCRKLSALHVRLCLLLAFECKDRFVCTTTNEALAKKLRVSARTITRLLADLVKQKWIEITERRSYRDTCVTVRHSRSITPRWHVPSPPRKAPERVDTGVYVDMHLDTGVHAEDEEVPPSETIPIDTVPRRARRFRR